MFSFIIIDDGCYLTVLTRVIGFLKEMVAGGVFPLTEFFFHAGIYKPYTVIPGGDEHAIGHVIDYVQHRVPLECPGGFQFLVFYLLVPDDSHQIPDNPGEDHKDEHPEKRVGIGGDKKGARQEDNKG